MIVIAVVDVVVYTAVVDVYTAVVAAAATAAATAIGVVMDCCGDYCCFSRCSLSYCTDCYIYYHSAGYAHFPQQCVVFECGSHDIWKAHTYLKRFMANEEDHKTR